MGSEGRGGLLLVLNQEYIRLMQGRIQGEGAGDAQSSLHEMKPFSYTPFLSGAPPHKKYPGSAPVMETIMKKVPTFLIHVVSRATITIYTVTLPHLPHFNAINVDALDC